MKTLVKTLTAEDVASRLGDLFKDELKDIYWCETELPATISEMKEEASSQRLIATLDSMLLETTEHIKRVETIFTLIGMTPVTTKCLAMEGLIKDASLPTKTYKKGALRDAAIISAAKKIEHYEIASYGTLKGFAETLLLANAASVLDTILTEEKDTDQQLSEIAWPA
ncbi:MAG TPA: DUF892 family protein [Chryseolinea sp.]|nr:DUF892 family protein [Chryseolinea sp.]